MNAIQLMKQRVRECEMNGVSVLCYAEAILAGLADFSDQPGRFAIRTSDGQLASVLAPLFPSLASRNSVVTARYTIPLLYFNTAE